MSGYKFEIVSKDSDCHWVRIRCVGNGEIVFTSEQYASRQGAENAIESFADFVADLVRRALLDTVEKHSEL